MSSGHAVVDGSNIATEGRTEPSLAQLQEAVAAFEQEYDFTHVTVIVDASFEHRVSKAEREKARHEIESGRIITPPAGVIGRGDTFILQVAERANAVVLSNDSFQEFHGTYSWLFDEGRLIGGKPVPGVGWVYVPRAPVRGPVSRRATKATKAPRTATAAKKTSTKKAAKKATKSAKAAKKASKVVTKTTTAKKATPAKTSARKAAAKNGEPAAKPTRGEPTGATSPSPGTNPLRAWEKFRRKHPEGAVINAKVDRFSSHGAYAHYEDVEVYLPLRLLGDPPPRRARDAVSIDETLQLVVHRFDRARRGIDVGIVALEDQQDHSTGTSKSSRPGGPVAKKTTKKTAVAAKKRAAKKSATKKVAKAAKKSTAKKAAKAGSKRTNTPTAETPKRASKKATAKKATKAAKKSRTRRRGRTPPSGQ